MSIELTKKGLNKETINGLFEAIENIKAAERARLEGNGPIIPSFEEIGEQFITVRNDILALAEIGLRVLAIKNEVLEDKTRHTEQYKYDDLGQLIGEILLSEDPTVSDVADFARHIEAAHDCACRNWFAR